MLRLFTMKSGGILMLSGCYFDDYFRNIGVGFKVGKCTLDEKSCLEMGSYDTP